MTDPDTSTPAGVRDRAMLEVLYATGVRREEFHGLRLGDIDREAGTMRVLGKGDRERVVPLGSEAGRWLRAYVDEARPALMRGALCPCEGLWVGFRHRPLSVSAIRIIVRQYVRRAGLPLRTTLHTLRRSCATHLLDRGAHPLAVAMLLGHENLQSLSFYLRVPLRALKASHTATPPGQ